MVRPLLAQKLVPPGICDTTEAATGQRHQLSAVKDAARLLSAKVELQVKRQKM